MKPILFTLILYAFVASSSPLFADDSVTPLPPVEYVLEATKGPLTPLDDWPHRGKHGVYETGKTQNRSKTDRPDRRVHTVRQPTLTIFPTPEPPSAAVVICPGGGYGGLSFDKEGAFVAAWLRDRGVAAAVLKSPVTPKKGTHLGNGPLDAAQLALKYMNREFDAPTGVMGFSAGGHLAAMAANDRGDARVDFHALIYPVISMEAGVTHGGSRRNLLGESPTAERVIAMSAERRVDKETSRAFVVHTADDHVVPLEHSLRYAQACADNSVPVELHVFERGGHGYGMWSKEERLSTWPEAFERWLTANGLIRQ